VEAVHVATDAEGLQWLECADHEPTDNIAETKRADLMPIEQWFNENGIPWGDVPDLDEPVPKTERTPLERD
jgi:hypothetical protein